MLLNILRVCCAREWDGGIARSAIKGLRALTCTALMSCHHKTLPLAAVAQAASAPLGAVDATTDARGGGAVPSLPLAISVGECVVRVYGRDSARARASRAVCGHLLVCGRCGPGLSAH